MDFLDRLSAAEARDVMPKGCNGGAPTPMVDVTETDSADSSPGATGDAPKAKEKSPKRPASDLGEGEPAPKRFERSRTPSRKSATPSAKAATPAASAAKKEPPTKPAASAKASAKPPSAKPPTSKQLGEFGFKVLGPIAAGAFSTIVKAKHIESGTEVAVKTFARCEGPEAADHERELQVLRKLSEAHHAHICNLLAEYESPMGTHAMLFYCSGGSLHAHLAKLRKKQMAMGEENAAIVVAQIASALVLLHSNGIAHRDIKPANVLHDGRRWRLCDFGFAIVCGRERKLKKSCGTLAYQAPELLRLANTSEGEGYAGPEVDMWAFGCLLYEMRVGRTCFVAPDLESLKLRIKNGFKGGSESHPWLSHMKKERPLITALLAHDPDKRLTAEKVLSSKWVTSHCAPTQETKQGKAEAEARELVPVGWWCDVAGVGCLRPLDKGSKYPEDHRCWANNTGEYLVCEVCYGSEEIRAHPGYAELRQVSGQPTAAELKEKHGSGSRLEACMMELHEERGRSAAAQEQLALAVARAEAAEVLVEEFRSQRS